MGIREMVLERAKKEGLEKGLEEGRNEMRYAMVTNLLHANKFTIAEIASFSNTTEAFVRKVQKELSK